MMWQERFPGLILCAPLMPFAIVFDFPVPFFVGIEYVLLEESEGTM
jgi:hypothetical protein